MLEISQTTVISEKTTAQKLAQHSQSMGQDIADTSILTSIINTS